MTKIINPNWLFGAVYYEGETRIGTIGKVNSDGSVIVFSKGKEIIIEEAEKMVKKGKIKKSKSSDPKYITPDKLKCKVSKYWS